MEVDRHPEFSSGPLGVCRPQVRNPALGTIWVGRRSQAPVFLPWCCSQALPSQTLTFPGVHRNSALRSGKLVHPRDLHPLRKDRRRGDSSVLAVSSFECTVCCTQRKADHCLSTGFDLNHCQRWESYLFYSLSTLQPFLFV